MPRLAVVVLATVALLAVAPAPVLSGGRSSLATATAAAVMAVAFALCATALRRPLLAAVVVLCGPLLKVTAVIATAAEGPAAAVSSYAVVMDAAVSSFAATVVTLLLFVLSQSTSLSDFESEDVKVVRLADVEASEFHGHVSCPVEHDDHSSDAAASTEENETEEKASDGADHRLLTYAAHVALRTLVAMMFAVVTSKALLPTAPSAVITVTPECIRFLTAVVVACAAPVAFNLFRPEMVRREFSRLVDSNDTHKTHRVKVEKIQHRETSGINVPSFLMLGALITVAVITTCDLLPIPTLAAFVLRQCSVFGARAMAGCLGLSLLRLAALTVLLPLMVVSLAAPLRADRVRDQKRQHVRSVEVV